VHRVKERPHCDCRRSELNSCRWSVAFEPEPAVVPLQIKAFCKGKIAHYKVPRFVIFVDSYPMTVTGKIQKNILREQAKNILHPKHHK
jgi:fatty-acyl-CoA synthase